MRCIASVGPMGWRRRSSRVRARVAGPLAAAAAVCAGLLLGATDARAQAETVLLSATQSLNNASTPSTYRGGGVGGASWQFRYRGRTYQVNRIELRREGNHPNYHGRLEIFSTITRVSRRQICPRGC